MPRRPRKNLGGLVYHVLNRAVGRSRLFRTDEDFDAFIRCIDHAHAALPARVLAYCLMPNHWHLVLWPKKDGDLSEFLRLLTVTHTQRSHAAHRTAGRGPLYQGLRPRTPGIYRIVRRQLWQEKETGRPK